MEEDGFATDTAAFEQWLKTLAGVEVSSKIEIKDLRSGGKGRGVVAKEDIKEDEVLFTLPRTAILSVENSSLYQEYPHIVRAVEDPWMKLILCLVHESHMAASPFAPYLLILPSDFDSLMYWNTIELLALQNHPVIPQIGRNEADQVFKQALAPIISYEKEAFPTFKDLQGHELEKKVIEECHRWGSIIMSYAFDVPAEDDPAADPDIDIEQVDAEDMAKALVPLADLLNADADLANAHLFIEGEKFEMRSIRPIPANTEILNSYGPFPPAELQRRYGYITKRSRICDIVEVSGHELISAAIAASCGDERQIVEKMRSLHARGLLDDQSPYMISYAPPYNTQPFQPPLLFAAAEIFGREAPKHLADMLQYGLSMLPTTLEADKAELAQMATEKLTQGQRRKRIALEIRISQKLVFAGAIKTLRKVERGEINDLVTRSIKEDVENGLKGIGGMGEHEWQEEPDDATMAELEADRAAALELN